MFSGKVDADKRVQDIALEQPTALVTKASLQEKKKQRTFVPVQKARPSGNMGKIRNYNIKDWIKDWVILHFLWT